MSTDFVAVRGVLLRLARVCGFPISATVVAAPITFDTALPVARREPPLRWNEPLSPPRLPPLSFLPAGRPASSRATMTKYDEFVWILFPVRGSSASTRTPTSMEVRPT